MSYCSVVFLVCMWFPEAGITGSTGSVAVHNLWTRKDDLLQRHVYKKYYALRRLREGVMGVSFIWRGC